VKIRHLIEEAFRKLSCGDALGGGLSYRFDPRYEWLFLRDLRFQLVLNSGRYQYIKSTLSNERLRNDVGAQACSLDGIEGSPLFLGRYTSGSQEYGILINSRPWGRHHFMLVTLRCEPQVATGDHILSALKLLRDLGNSYEGTFSSAKAGASVQHFHVQYHEGEAAIWGNLKGRILDTYPVINERGVSTKFIKGWPAWAIAVSGRDETQVTYSICRVVDVCENACSRLAYNLGMRHIRDEFEILIFPRIAGVEKPVALNAYPDSWGRFSFNEMGGSIVLLTAEGLQDTMRAPEQIWNAISDMSIPQPIQTHLIRELLPRSARRVAD